MKEVKLKRYAGPFAEIPFKDHYIQSPIGLVEKDGGADTHLIFHLSYPKGGNSSVNSNTPPELCTVKYPDFNQAIQMCINEGRNCKISRSDMKSAFRHVCIRKDDFWLLMMKCKNPRDGKTYFFVDTCLAFGHSISCKIFQEFLDCVAHIVRHRTQKPLLNYLDDYLFAHLVKLLCDAQVSQFIQICSEINFPVNLDKTFWGTTRLVFLGLLIDTELQMVFIPVEKVQKAEKLIDIILQNKAKKITLHQLQKICGFLNFLCRCVIPGRAFTRRLYVHTENKDNKLKPHHHLRVTSEMKADLLMWRQFLRKP